MSSLLAFFALFVTYQAFASTDRWSKLASQGETTLYLPSTFAADSPAGSYYCYEYEFGLIWTSEVITLNTDGSSIYAYSPPYSNIVTGTWVYTQSIQEVGFSNFRWPTATYQAPDRLWASLYLPHVDFTIAIDCGRR